MGPDGAATKCSSILSPTRTGTQVGGGLSVAKAFKMVACPEADCWMVNGTKKEKKKTRPTGASKMPS